MIIKPTVLVLGAGASKPYGFPTGWGLTRDIISNLNTSSSQLYTVLRDECHIDGDRIAQFRDALDRSFVHSVDAFLEHRRDQMDVGKAAIAASLIPCELLSKFSRAHDMQGADQRWYSYLFAQMGSKPEHFKENRLSIITFNYDRSLEFAMFYMLANRYQYISPQDIIELYSSIPIIHVHGQLGFPDFLDVHGERRAYEADVAQRNILIATRNIKIVSEIEEPTEEFQNAFRVLADAQTICFVGFGYNIINMSRLRLDKIPTDKRFIGTGQDLSQDDYSFAYEYLSAVSRKTPVIHLNRDALWVMQNAGVFAS